MSEITAQAFKQIGDMEYALVAIRALLNGIAHIGETLNKEEGETIQQIAWVAKEKCDSIEGMRTNLFRLTHPRRDHFEAEGWPE